MAVPSPKYRKQPTMLRRTILIQAFYRLPLLLVRLTHVSTARHQRVPGTEAVGLYWRFSLRT